MSQVYTTLGLLDRSELEVKDIVLETDEGRLYATEWYKDGQLVRRDGWFNRYQGLEAHGG